MTCLSPGRTRIDTSTIGSLTTQRQGRPAARPAADEVVVRRPCAPHLERPVLRGSAGSTRALALPRNRCRTSTRNPPLFARIQGMDELWSQIGITWTQTLGVALAAAVLYGVYAVVLRAWGHRLLSSSSTLSLAVASLMGAVVGRSMLGNSPTLIGGLVALGTLIMLEGLFSELRSRTRLLTRQRRGAVVVLVEGRFQTEALREVHLSEREVAVRLRQAGVLSIADLGLVLLEPRGSLTVVRVGQRIDARLLVGVLRPDAIPASLVSGA